MQFLMDESDTILAYENKGRTEPFGEGLLMSFLSSMDRVQQLELIYREDGDRVHLLEGGEGGEGGGGKAVDLHEQQKTGFTAWV